MIEKNIFKLINSEKRRQKKNIELIASENFPSKNVLKATASCLTNKYAEGYPEQESIDEFCKEHPDFKYTGNIGRYYGGCSKIDAIELYAQYMFQKAFNTTYHVNVQPHSGSQANAAAYAAVLNPGDTVLAMSLSDGGHLTHGSSVNFSGKLYNFIFYNLTQSGSIDYADIRRKILQYRPKLIVAGASAYSREIHFNEIRYIIDECSEEIRLNDETIYKPYFMADISHIAGLIIAGEHKTPFSYADIITTTTHKTFRGPRGAVIFCRPDLAKKIDSAVFPGTQGGPLEHIIAAKAIAAEEACTQEYRDYIKQVVANTKAMCNEFRKMGYHTVGEITENHLFILDFSMQFPLITGKQVQDACDAHNITLNKNCVPDEKRSPKETSGVRIGCAAMTTKGYKEKDFIKVAHKIDKIIREVNQNAIDRC